MFGFYSKNLEKMKIAKNIVMVEFLGEDFITENSKPLSAEIAKIVDELMNRLRRNVGFTEPDRGSDLVGRIIKCFNGQPQHVQNCFIAMACQQLNDNGNKDFEPPMIATKWYSPSNPLLAGLYEEKAIDIAIKGFVTDLKRLGYWSDYYSEIHPSLYGMKVYLWSQSDHPSISDAPGKYIIPNKGTKILLKSDYRNQPLVQYIKNRPE
jgi:hypothetical protein